MRPFTMFGYSHLFDDIVDCVESIGGELREVVLNVPETVRAGRPTLQERVDRLSRVGRPINVIRNFSNWRPNPSLSSYVIGFSRKQAAPLLREIEESLGCPVGPVKHKSSITQLGVDVGYWSIVNAGAILGSWSKIGNHVIVNRGANIGHDVVVGDHCFISPAAVLCSHVVLDEDVLVGANATILPDVHVGAGATIAAGAVVLGDVPAHTMVAGVPAVVKNAPIGV